MSTRDINKSLDERSDNSVNITNEETGENGQSNQKEVEKKIRMYYRRQYGKTQQSMESIK